MVYTGVGVYFRGTPWSKTNLLIFSTAYPDGQIYLYPYLHLCGPPCNAGLVCRSSTFVGATLVTGTTTATCNSTTIEVTCSEAMLALSFSTLMVK